MQGRSQISREGGAAVLFDLILAMSCHDIARMRKGGAETSSLCMTRNRKGVLELLQHLI